LEKKSRLEREVKRMTELKNKKEVRGSQCQVSGYEKNCLVISIELNIG